MEYDRFVKNSIVVSVAQTLGKRSEPYETRTRVPVIKTLTLCRDNVIGRNIRTEIIPYYFCSRNHRYSVEILVQTFSKTEFTNIV